MNLSKNTILLTTLSILLYCQSKATLVDTYTESQHYMKKSADNTFCYSLGNDDTEIWADLDNVNCQTHGLRKALINQTGVTHLSLSTLSLENDTLKTLSQFPKIQHLFLKENSFTDEGAQYLKHFHNLKEIDLSRNYITSTGLHYISLKNLKSLYINFLKITDISLIKKLQEAPQLETLHICGNSTNDEILKLLAQSSSLKYIDVSYSQVTSQCVENMRQQNPKLSIHFE